VLYRARIYIAESDAEANRDGQTHTIEDIEVVLPLADGGDQLALAPLGRVAFGRGRVKTLL